MKKLFFITASVFLFWSVSVRAQITLDNDLTPWGAPGESFYLAQISSIETKYVFLDTLNNTFSLHNMDFTPFMENITVPEPFIQGTTFMQPIYITRTLFDCDSSNIEYAYQSAQNTNKPFRIMRTDGTVIFQRDSANGPFCVGACLGLSDIIRPIRNTSAGTKLFLQHFDDNIDGKRHILVYSLCGELPSKVFEFAPFNPSFVELFPNPASYTINFKINPPDNINDYELVIFDNSANEIRREKMSYYNYNLTLDITHLSSGSYSYVLGTTDKAYETGKFIITK